MERDQDKAKRWQFSLGCLFVTMSLACLAAFLYREFGVPGVAMLLGGQLGGAIGCMISPRWQFCAVGAAVGLVLGAAIGIVTLFV